MKRSREQTTLRGAFWWIDRWRQSSSFRDLTLAEQGAFRNLIDELWLRGGVIPNDDRILANCCGDATEWPAVKAAVLRRFHLTSEGWRNETHDEVYDQSRRRAIAQKNWRERRLRDNAPDNTPDNTPNSPFTVHRSPDKELPPSLERGGAAAALSEEQLPAQSTTNTAAVASDSFHKDQEQRARAIKELGDLCVEIAGKEGKAAREVLIENSRTAKGIIMTNPAKASLAWIGATLAKLKERNDGTKRAADADRTRINSESMVDLAARE